ncbi:hypothetical protein ECG_02441 [Echinococcus granulosus]|nr:hypothetical protein ECG_02441 [Echinococcus granulosus]
MWRHTATHIHISFSSTQPNPTPHHSTPIHFYYRRHSAHIGRHTEGRVDAITTGCCVITAASTPISPPLSAPAMPMYMVTKTGSPIS